MRPLQFLSRRSSEIMLLAYTCAVPAMLQEILGQGSYEGAWGIIYVLMGTGFCAGLISALIPGRLSVHGLMAVVSQLLLFGVLWEYWVYFGPQYFAGFFIGFGIVLRFRETNPQSPASSEESTHVVSVGEHIRMIMALFVVVISLWHLSPAVVFQAGNRLAKTHETCDLVYAFQGKPWEREGCLLQIAVRDRDAAACVEFYRRYDINLDTCLMYTLPASIVEAANACEDLKLSTEELADCQELRCLAIRAVNESYRPKMSQQELEICKK